METSYSFANQAVLNDKMTGEVWDPCRLVFQMLITMFCMHKTTNEGWDTWRLVILVLKPLFCIQKLQMKAGTIETSYSDSNHVVLHAQNDR